MRITAEFDQQHMEKLRFLEKILCLESAELLQQAIDALYEKKQIEIESEIQKVTKKLDNSLSFSERWQGQFTVNETTNDARLDYLKQRYQI